MPRTAQEILDHADDAERAFGLSARLEVSAKRFSDHVRW
jgi:hypothetical protein